jgi:hypothetical protein
MFNYTKEMIEKAVNEAPVEVIDHGKTPDEYKEFNGLKWESPLDKWIVTGSYILVIEKFMSKDFINKVIVKRYSGISKFILEKVFRTTTESFLPHELLHYVQYNNFVPESKYIGMTEEDVEKLPFEEKMEVRHGAARDLLKFKLGTEIDAYAFDMVRENANRFRVSTAAFLLARGKMYQFGKIATVKEIRNSILERMEYFKENMDMFKPLVDFKLPE